jgi:hypothetical protein
MQMITRLLAVRTVLASLVTGQEWTKNSTDPFVTVPAPWTLHGDIYSIPLLPSSTKLPTKAYAPLERTSSFTEGDYLGIIGMIQVIRYTESPVGPYDELLIVPGYFSYDREGKRQTRVRVSRIYVSQKYTAWNGRTSKSECPTTSRLAVHQVMTALTRLEYPQAPGQLRLGRNRRWEHLFKGLSIRHHR